MSATSLSIISPAMRLECAATDKHSVREACGPEGHLQRNSGEVVRPQNTDTLFKERDPKAEMNIFIVGELEMDSNRHSTADIIQGMTIGFQNILCEDNVPDSIAETLAHEALHFLLREESKNSLAYGTSELLHRVQDPQRTSK
jgi:hypothetical protein